MSKPHRGYNNSLVERRGKRSQHVIDDISYSRDFIVCTCAWKGRVDDYQSHRRKEEPESFRH